MPDINSFSYLVRDWEASLAAYKANAELLVSAEPQKLELEQILVEGRALKDRQETLTAQKQRVTQELKELQVRGREAARRLRAAVKAVLGTDNELLVQFNVVPRRKRKARKTAEEKPTEPAQQATAQQATAPQAE